jgi:hypothetical protein
MKKFLFGIVVCALALSSTFYLGHAAGDWALEENDDAAYHQYTGDTLFTVAAGKSIIIETSPSGAEILDIECPAGKQFSVKLTIRINETDE